MWHGLPNELRTTSNGRGARWLSGSVSDSGARGPGFETYLRRVVSLSKILYSPKVLVNYPGSDGSMTQWWITEAKADHTHHISLCDKAAVKICTVSG